MGQMGSPVTRLKTHTKPCLLTCATTSMVLPSWWMREELGRGGVVVIPDIVMHHLEMPEAFAGAGVQGQQAVGE